MPAKRNRFRWFKYLAGGLLLLIIVALVFYQQIVFGIVQVVAQEVAKSQAFELRFKIGGSILSSLYIEDLHLRPLPENRTLPLERVDAKRIALRYNLPALFNKDFLNVIDLIELKNVDLIVRPSPGPAPPPAPNKSNGLRFPAVVPRKIDIQDVNLLVRTPTGNLEIKKFGLEFQQGGDGYVTSEAISVPGVGEWGHLHAGLNDRQNRLVLAGLNLPPLLDVRQLQIDLSGSEQGKYAVSLNADALGSSIAASASYFQPADKPSIEATLSVIGLELAPLQKLAAIPISGSIQKIEAHLNGELDHPTSLSGSLSADAKSIKYENYLIDNVGLSIVIDHGKGDIQELSVDSGANQLRAAGNFTLANDSKELVTGSAADIGLAVSVTEPERFVPGLNAASLLSGSIGLLNGRVQGAFSDFVEDIGLPKSLPGFSISKVDTRLIAVAALPIASDIWSSICAAITTECSDIRYQDARIEKIQLTGGMTDGKTVATTTDMASGESRAEIETKAPLPTRDAPFAPEQITANLKFNLASISDFIRQNQVEGALTANGELQVDRLQVNGNVRAAGNQLKYHGMILQSLALDTVIKENNAQIRSFRIGLDTDNYLQISGSAGLTDPFQFKIAGGLIFKDLAVLNDILQNIGLKPGISGQLITDFGVSGDIHNPSAKIQMSGSQIEYSGFPVQNVNLQAKVENSLATIETGRIDLNASNYVDLTGDVSLKEPYPYQTKGGIELNDLGVLKQMLIKAGQAPVASGNLHADWSIAGDARKGAPDGALQVLGNQINYRGLLIQNIQIEANLLDQKLDLPACRITFNKNNFVDAKGNALLEEPYDYNSNAVVQFQDLGFLNEAIKSFGQDLGLGGKLNVSWSGKGPVKDQTGTFELHGDKLRTNTVQSTKIDLSGSYRGLNAEIPQLSVASPYADLDASLRCSPQAFEIPTLNIRRSGNTVTGNVKIPLDFGPGKKIPLDLDHPVNIDIAADKISLASLQTGKPQVTGTVGFRIQAAQTLRDPLIQLIANARTIKSASVSNLSAANVDFALRIDNKVLTIDGKIVQSDIQPLRVTGRMPLDAGQIIQTGRIPEDSALQFAVNWPDTNLAFLRKLLPDIKVIEGSAGANVNVNGTIKKPDLSGAIRANLARFQANTDTVPPISAFATNISFRHDRITIDQLKGLAGGGSFGSVGGIDLTDGTNPKFDITLTGRKVLLTRSDGIIVRANADLAVRGPLSAVEIGGTVGITDSRFFKDVDILPLNLPGRPPPQPPARAMPKIAIETPPFSDWKFNIAIRTDDPFLIQSNLARGRVSINLQAAGTGAAPTVTGVVRVDRLVAELPFSKMEIDGGTVDFVQGANILDPSLSITGRSTVSDYDVRARIFGNASNPTVLLDSSPPLSQGDILVLLATGSPSSTFAQDPSLLAGRATFIVLQQLYKKFFPSTNRADEQKEPFIDRFSVNVTPGDRAGEQDIVSSFKLTKNWQIIADLGTSSYQGRLKYLIRFR
jgi:autotransporter translocation and assembly factor TamB